MKKKDFKFVRKIYAKKSKFKRAKVMKNFFLISDVLLLNNFRKTSLFAKQSNYDYLNLKLKKFFRTATLSTCSLIVEWNSAMRVELHAYCIWAELTAAKQKPVVRKKIDDLTSTRRCSSKVHTSRRATSCCICWCRKCLQFYSVGSIEN